MSVVDGHGRTVGAIGGRPMDGIKAMWHAGINTLSDSPLIVPNENDNVLTVRMRVLERYATEIRDGLDSGDDWYENRRGGWKRDGGIVPSAALASTLNRSGDVARVQAAPDAGGRIGLDIAVLNALLYIARYSPDLYVVFDAEGL